MTTPQTDASDSGSPLRALAFFAFAAVIIVIAVVIVVSHNKNEAPFTGVQADAKLVGLQVLKPSDAQGSNVTAALRSLGGASSNNIELPNGHKNWQYVVGRVDVAPEPPAHAIYDVIVVDNRLHQVVTGTFGYPETEQSTGTGRGWDNADASLAKAFDFSDSSANEAAFFTPGDTTSLPFVAVLRGNTLPVANDHSDLSVVLALTNGQHVYWSEKLN